MPRSNSTVQIEVSSPKDDIDQTKKIGEDLSIKLSLAKKQSCVPNHDVIISHRGSIKTHDGYYIFPVNDIQHKVAIGYFDSHKSIWTIQKVEDCGSGMVTIQDCNKHYLSANSHNQVSTDPCQSHYAKWWIEDDHYFKNVHGSYLVANNGKVYCGGKGQWSKFDIQKPVVDGSLSIVNKKSYTGWSKSYYFRLAEKKLRCWNGIPKEFQPIISKPRKRFTLHWSSSSFDNPKQEWDTSQFKYIAKVSNQKISVSFLEELGKEPLHLEAPTAEKCNIWFNALQLECKANINLTLSADAKTAELSRCGYVESNPEVSVSRSLLDSWNMNDPCEEENMLSELGSAETVDVQTLKNIVEQSVIREKIEREKKKEDNAKFQRQLDERQTTAKRIEQEIKKENEQMIQRRDELACITNQRDNSGECLKNRLMELQQQRKNFEQTEISSDAPHLGFNRPNGEHVLKFLKNEPTFFDPVTGDLVAKQVSPDVNLISNFMKNFDIPSINEAVGIIFTIMQEQFTKEIKDLEEKNNQRNKLIQTDFLNKETERIQKKKYSAELHAKDLNQKINEYNVGAKALREAQKKNNEQIMRWRKHKKKQVRDYENSLEEYRVETSRNP